MTVPVALTALVGRGEEIASIAEVLDRARRGTGGAMVLWGEPGIGRSALLDQTVAAAPEFSRLTMRAARYESRTPFAGLHTLLQPVEHCIATLPVDQASALRGALGLDATRPGRLLTAVAVLSLLSGLAAEQPVLVAVDDAHLLDDDTAFVLGFLARRVRAAPVVVVLADHDAPETGPWEGLPSHRLGPISDRDAGRLVTTAHPGADDATVTRAVEDAGGNPLALLEMPTLTQRPAGTVPVGPRLRRAFEDRLRTMTAPARELVLLLAAARAGGDQLTLARAAAAQGADRSAWDEASRSGLLAGSPDRPALRHPLVRAAVYDSSSPAERQAAHRALAAAIPEYTAGHTWHRAAAAHDVDEEIAGLLELSAPPGAGAVRTLRRAAELSPDPSDATRRLAGAAVAAWHAGDVATARRSLDEARDLTDETQATRASRGLRGVLELAEGSLERAHRSLTSDMDEFDDPRTGVELGAAAMHAGWSAARDDLLTDTLARLADLPAPDSVDRPPLDDLLPTLRVWWGPTTEPTVEVLPGDVAETLARIRAVESQLLPTSPLGLALGIDEPLADVVHLLTREHRRNADHTSLAAALARAARLDIAAGRWDAAGSAAAEGLALAERIGAEHVAAECRNCLGWLAAVRGDDAGVEQTASRTLRSSVQRRDRATSAAAYWNRGIAALSAGRSHEALALLTHLGEPGHDAAHPTFSLLATVDTVDAAVQEQRPDVAERHVERIEAWVHRSRAPWARSAAHLARALVDERSAERSYQAALDVPGAAAQPFAHARTRLLYGEWLRRRRRRSDASRQLDVAVEVFHTLGAHPMLDRARREQRLTEPPVRRASPVDAESEALTAQEQRVARLAAEALTNREIAARLRISDRTVGHHLTNVFSKLGIRSRRALTIAGLDGEP